MIDAVAFVVERPRQHHDAAVRRAHHRAHGRAKIHSLVNAGELAIEHAARAKAVGRLRPEPARESCHATAVQQRSTANTLVLISLSAAICFCSSGPGSTNFGATLSVPVR